MVILELGAGTSVPNVRFQSEKILQERINKNTYLIRVNPDDQSLYGLDNEVQVIQNGKQAESWDQDKKCLV